MVPQPSGQGQAAAFDHAVARAASHERGKDPQVPAARTRPEPEWRSIVTSELTDELLQSFAGSIDDVASATTMPPLIYTSDEFLEFEKRALFDREWLCVGVASSIPAVGDYFTCEVNDEPIIVARGKDGAIN